MPPSLAAGLAVRYQPRVVRTQPVSRPGRAAYTLAHQPVRMQRGTESYPHARHPRKRGSASPTACERPRGVCSGPVSPQPNSVPSGGAPSLTQPRASPYKAASGCVAPSPTLHERHRKRPFRARWRRTHGRYRHQRHQRAASRSSRPPRTTWRGTPTRS